jgi:hypothetical protein
MEGWVLQVRAGASFSGDENARVTARREQFSVFLGHVTNNFVEKISNTYLVGRLLPGFLRSS